MLNKGALAGFARKISLILPPCEKAVIFQHSEEDAEKPHVAICEGVEIDRFHSLFDTTKVILHSSDYAFYPDEEDTDICGVFLCDPMKMSDADLVTLMKCCVMHSVPSARLEWARDVQTFLHSYRDATGSAVRLRGIFDDVPVSGRTHTMPTNSLLRAVKDRSASPALLSDAKLMLSLLPHKFLAIVTSFHSESRNNMKISLISAPDPKDNPHYIYEVYDAALKYITASVELAEHMRDTTFGSTLEAGRCLGKVICAKIKGYSVERGVRVSSLADDDESDSIHIDYNALRTFEEEVHEYIKNTSSESGAWVSTYDPFVSLLRKGEESNSFVWECWR